MPTGRVAVVVVPTYNEAANIPELVSRLFSLDIADLRLYVVDDNSPDGTARVARRLSDERDGRDRSHIQASQARPRHRIRRPGSPGHWTTVANTSYRWTPTSPMSPTTCLRCSASWKTPTSSSDRAIPKTAAPILAGDSSDGLLSAFGNHVIRFVTGLKVRDVTSGFKAYTAAALGSLDMNSFRCKGFGFQSEVAYQCQARGHVVLEHPIIFIDRTKGKSKMSVHIIIEAIWKLTLLRLRRQ